MGYCLRIRSAEEKGWNGQQYSAPGARRGRFWVLGSGRGRTCNWILPGRRPIVTSSGLFFFFFSLDDNQDGCEIS